MKQVFLYVLAITLLGTTLTSCLGDTKSSYEGTSEFGVIKISEDGVKYLIPQSGVPLTWNGISKYNAGDAMLASYKVSNLQSGILNAEYVSPIEEFPLGNHRQISRSTVDTTVTGNPDRFKAFTTRFYSGNSTFSDKWLFRYSVSVKEGQTSNVQFYYDDSKQKDQNGANLPQNTAIVDVRLDITGTPNSGAQAVTKENNIVVDFRLLRNWLRPSNLDEDPVVRIWLRYHTESNKDRPYWASNAGGFVYSKDDN
ncbi:MAG: hypothetical protein RL662_1465 [Bacteroidota bacterium]|jgi:hypothetical protein